MFGGGSSSSSCLFKASHLFWVPSTMSAAWLALTAIILYVLVRIFNLASIPERPALYCSDSKFLEALLKACPTLSDVYVPPSVWGRSGHLQTIIHGVFGRIHSPLITGERCALNLTDGATLTFDVFEPASKHSSCGDFTLAICPGIANSSDSLYIKTFVENAQNSGYRCAVVNHLGSLPDVPLTSPRVFTYGGTEELHRMICYLFHRYLNTSIILVGFSMGANIITKYLGEKGQRSPSLLCGISICQGYDGQRAQPLLQQWENMRRFYLWVMTETMKGLIWKHEAILLSNEAKKHFDLDQKKIFSSQTLVEFDESYTRRMSGCSSLSDFYKQNSSITFMDNITVPMLFLNAADDPLIPPELWEPAHRFVESHEKSIFVLPKHGGHLGFFERGHFFPEKLTWIDKVIVEFANAMTA